MPMSYQYKGYNPANSKHVNKYVKDHYRTLTVRFDQSFYDDELKPLCDDLGVPVATFVKQLIADYIATHK